MPRSSISMADFDGDYTFDIDKYLIKNYPRMDKPSRRAVCAKVQADFDQDIVTDEIDAILLQYLLEQQDWRDEEDDKE